MFIAAVLVLVGCTSKKACHLNSDCSEVERCVSGECTVLCRTDRDCMSFETCAVGECKLVGTGSGAGGAGGGSVSTGGGGGGTVDAGADAGTDAGVDAGVPVVDAGVDAGIDDAGTGGGGGGGGGATGGGGGGGGGGGPVDAGNGQGVYGDACVGAGDCMSGLCIGNAVNGLRMCTIQCANENACDPTHACLPVQSGSGTINICVPSDSGQSCPSGQGTTCIAGICLVHPGSVSLSVCATPCQSARACPNGFSCSLVQLGGSMQKVCSPVATACNSQGVSNQCISRWCSNSALTPNAGICTSNCSTAADCPAGWACGFDDAASGVADRCQPIGNACTVDGAGNNNCYSKTCAQGTPQGDYCTAFCMDVNFNAVPARCPTGYSCINEGGTGSPLWVCEH